MNNDIRHIRELLRRFYEGATTPEEEQFLAGYLSTDENIPEDLTADKKLFAALEEEMDKTVVPEGLADSIMDSIDARTMTETTQQVSSPYVDRHRFKRRLSAAAIGVAAAITLIITIITSTWLITDRKSIVPGSSTVAVTHPDKTFSPSGDTSRFISGGTKAAESLTLISRTDPKHVSVPVTAARRNVRNKTIAESADSARAEEALDPRDSEALYAGLAALDKAVRHLAYAQERIENTESRLEETVNNIYDILNINPINNTDYENN